jgi:hypothetical protein
MTVMSRTCPHCSGTTFCGGYRHRGNLLTQPACTTCVVKSGLRPTGTYHRIICSVCGGTGVVQPKEVAARKGPSTTLLLALCVVLLVASGFFALSVFWYYRSAEQPEEIRENVARTTDLPRRNISCTNFRDKLGIDMTKFQVQATVGEPDATHETGSGLSTVEFWYYGCNDGRVEVRLQGGRVIAIKP